MAVAENTMGQTPGGKLTFIPAADGVPVDVPFDLAGDPFALQVQAFERVVAEGAAWPWPVTRDLAVMAAIDALATSSRRLIPPTGTKRRLDAPEGVHA